MVKWQQDEILREVRRIVHTNAVLRTKAQRHLIDPAVVKRKLDDDLRELRLLLAHYKIEH